MKPLFAIDVTTYKDNKIQNGSEFITRFTALKDHPEKKERVFRTKTYTEKKAPLTLRLFNWLMALAVLIFGAITVYNGVLLGFVNYYAESSLIVWLCLGAFIAWGITGIICLIIRKRAKDDISKAEARRRAAINVVDNVYAKNGVPVNAIETDVLSFKYKLVNGVPNLVIPSSQYTDYMNVSMRAFVKDGKLCLADLVNTYAIPLSEIKHITKINKPATFPYWNKEDRPTDAKYSSYNIKYHYGKFKIDSYCLLTIVRGNVKHGIFFPIYELPTFEALTGLKAI